MTKGKPTLHITGLEWFDKINGVTYFSAEVLIEGKTVLEVSAGNGYGEQYIQESLDRLEANGDIPTQHCYLPRTAWLRGHYDFTYSMRRAKKRELIGWRKGD